MVSCCLKRRKNTESKNPRVVMKKKTEEKWFHQTMRFVAVKSRNLFKSKMLVDY